MSAPLDSSSYSTKPPKIRLDHYLASQYTEISRSFLQKLCNTDQVLVNGQPQKSGYKLRPTDKVVVLYDMAGIEKIAEITLPVLFEDKNIIVINKPAGVISHSRGKFWNEPSVASFIRQITGQSGERPGIVHRLDRATSGVMICAKNEQAMPYLQKQFADRTVRKSYVAIASGHLEPSQAIIDMPIERNPKTPSVFRVGSNGKPAQTKYTVQASNEEYDEVLLEPLTGRTHQLRVHLAYQGHPILGDTLYGGATADRLCLHAQSLTIKLPDGVEHTFKASLPELFMEVMHRGL